MSVRSPARPRPRTTPREGFLGQLLDPIDRLSETIFSVLILLTFTLAFRVFKLGGIPGQPGAGEYLDELVLAAVGATLAWGIIDGVMYALTAVLERGESHRLLRRLQAAESEREGVAVVAEEFDYLLEPIADDDERQHLYRHVFASLRTGQPRPVGFKREDLAGALGSVLVAVIAVLPSLAPLVLLRGNPELAIRASNVVSFAVLFYSGYQWGQHSGSCPWRTGLLVMVVGVAMVAVAIPLGG